MEVHFSPWTEARLRQFAASAGKDAEQVVEEAVSRMLERQAHFIEGVNRGIESADRGELIDHAEVVNRIERSFRSDPDPMDAVGLQGPEKENRNGVTVFERNINNLAPEKP